MATGRVHIATKVQYGIRQSRWLPPRLCYAVIGNSTRPPGGRQYLDCPKQRSNLSRLGCSRLFEESGRVLRHLIDNTSTPPQVRHTVSKDLLNLFVWSCIIN